jgi:hypothetical protein
MTTKFLNSSKRAELSSRGIDPESIITLDNFNILLTQVALTQIANRISAEINRKLEVSEIKFLHTLITRFPSYQLAGKKYNQIVSALAGIFISESLARKNLSRDDEKEELSEYQKQELKQLTDDEHPYKISAFSDRRGDALVDRKSNVVTPDMVNISLYEGMQVLKKTLSPDFINDIIKKNQTLYTTFTNINLTRQVLQFDTKNRLVSNNTERAWNINISNVEGRRGDVRAQDTVQQVLAMKIIPFDIPNCGISNSYDTVRLFIKEFLIIVPNYLTLSEAHFNNYHFEFQVTTLPSGKLRLTPKEPLYIFRQPIISVDHITMIFFSPFSVVQWCNDSGIFTITYGNPTLFTSTVPHGLSTGDIIYVGKYSPATSIDEQIYNLDGHIITKIDNFNFTILLDSSSMPGSVSDIQVYFGSKRFFTQIEFISLEP